MFAYGRAYFARPQVQGSDRTSKGLVGGSHGFVSSLSFSIAMRSPTPLPIVCNRTLEGSLRGRLQDLVVQRFGASIPKRHPAMCPKCSARPGPDGVWGGSGTCPGEAPQRAALPLPGYLAGLQRPFPGLICYYGCMLSVLRHVVNTSVTIISSPTTR